MSQFGYRIGLTLAHHELRQMQRIPEVESAVMTHACTRVSFKIGDDDARRLADGFESFDAKALKTLEKYHAIARVERSDFDFNLSFPKPNFPSPEEARKRTAEVIAFSRSQYAVPRSEVEASVPTTSPAGPTKTQTPPPSVVQPTQPKILIAPVEPPPAPTGSYKKIEEALPIEMPKSPTEPKDLGRGGASHQAIQERLKTEAHRLGFSAEVEKQLKKGSNAAADLVLRLGELSVAVEIAVTTTVTHEFGNVQKCLAAGFSNIAVVSVGQKKLDDIAAAVRGGLKPEEASKVCFFTPDQFIAELGRLAATVKSEPAAPPGERKRHGRIVRRHAPSMSEEEIRLREDALRQVMLDALRRPR